MAWSGVQESHRGLSPRSGHQAGADMDAPWLPHSVKEATRWVQEDAVVLPVPPGGTQFCPSAPRWILSARSISSVGAAAPRWAGDEDVLVNRDGKAMTMARDVSEHRRTQEDTGSCMGQPVLLCQCCSRDPLQGCSSRSLLLPVHPHAQEQHGSTGESGWSRKALQTQPAPRLEEHHPTPYPRRDAVHCLGC